MKTIGIVGNGYVGRATALLKNQDLEVLVYDKDPYKSQVGELSHLIDYCDFIFVCVPTPMNPDGTCCTLIVDKVVFELVDLGYDKERIIIKSTVPVGTSRRLGTMFMPEFLTEKCWKTDFLNQSNWILGRDHENRQTTDELYDIFKVAHENCILSHDPVLHFLSTGEAELVKYTRNCFLAAKVSFFNEIYGFCVALELDYDRVKDLVVLDERIGESHTQIPGPDGKRGFGGTCFPKDMAAFETQLSKIGTRFGIIKACIDKNNNIDRPEKDWKDNKGRAVIDF